MKVNYILNLNHKFPFEQFGKKWIMYLPGFEGMYAISEDYCLCSLERICFYSNGRKANYKQKLLSPSKKFFDITEDNSSLGLWNYIVSKENIRKQFTKKRLKEIVSSAENKQDKEANLNFPFKFWF